MKGVKGMNKKYVLTETKKEFFGVTLYQIKAVKSFGNVKEGDIGGWIEKEKNLSHNGNAWVSNNAIVRGNARVYGNARVSGNATVSGNARVYGDALVSGDATVSGNAWVYGDAMIKSCKDIFLASPVGSENGTLTAYTTKTAEIEITRGCFKGTLAEFETAVNETHNNNHYAKEYLALIEFIKIRFPNVEVKRNER